MRFGLYSRSYPFDEVLLANKEMPKTLLLNYEDDVEEIRSREGNLIQSKFPFKRHLLSLEWPSMSMAFAAKINKYYKLTSTNRRNYVSVINRPDLIVTPTFTGVGISDVSYDSTTTQTAALYTSCTTLESNVSYIDAPLDGSTISASITATDVWQAITFKLPLDHINIDPFTGQTTDIFNIDMVNNISISCLAYATSTVDSKATMVTNTYGCSLNVWNQKKQSWIKFAHNTANTYEYAGNSLMHIAIDKSRNNLSQYIYNDGTNNWIYAQIRALYKGPSTIVIDHIRMVPNQYLCIFRDSVSLDTPSYGFTYDLGMESTIELIEATNVISS